MAKTVSRKLAPQDTSEPEHRDLTPHQAGALVARAAQSGDPVRELEARRNLAEAKIADAIKKTLAKAPKLTPTQIQRLTLLLRRGGERQEATLLTRSGVQR